MTNPSGVRRSTDTTPSFQRRVRRRLEARWPLVEILLEDRDANSGWRMPGFHAVALARVGAWADDPEGGTWTRRRVSSLCRNAGAVVKGVYGIELPSTVTLGRRVRIAHQHGIIIHPRAVIGDDCVLRQGVTLGAGRGDERLFDKQAPRLGQRVSIGANAVIVGNVRIGDDATIGPNATVMTHIPAGATVLAPAPRILRRPEPEPATGAPDCDQARDCDGAPDRDGRSS